MSARVDLALALLAEDLGADLARVVARILVVYHRRADGQSQFSTVGSGAESDLVSERFERLFPPIETHLMAMFNSHWQPERGQDEQTLQRREKDKRSTQRKMEESGSIASLPIDHDRCRRRQDGAAESLQDI